MKDLDTQISFVVEAIERILKQIDPDPLSPTFGCAHLAYWRDKTSDVADMRRQEVMWTFALLYTRDYPGSSWKENKKLKDAMEALLDFWCRNQYPDGSLDEWYKGERAFAASAFSTHAVARTLAIVQDSLSEDIVTLAKKKLEKTACWLVHHNDLFKTNHQAVGVAALAWAGKVLANNDFTENARKKFQSITAVQTKEGWFPEVGHMDVGYTFVTIEFVLMAMELWSDWQHIEPFRRAFDFACEWIHPDLTIGDEYGVCHNPYLSRIAVILMSRFSKRAVFLRRRFEEESVGFKGFSSVLADDLRLLRWAYQPLVAYEYVQKTSNSILSESERIPLANPASELRIYDDAGLSRFSCCGCTGVFAAAAGGLLRLFGRVSGRSLSDYGYAIQCNDRYATNQTYNRNIKIQKEQDGLMLTCPIAPVKKFMPPFWARIILHIACSTAIGSRLTRKGIDIIRKKKGTALNQSSANLGSFTSDWMLQRQVSFQQEQVVVRDKLTFTGPVKTKLIYFLGSVDDNWTTYAPIISRIPNLPGEVSTLEIIKCYQSGENWKLTEVRSELG